MSKDIKLVGFFGQDLGLNPGLSDLTQVTPPLWIAVFSSINPKDLQILNSLN